MTNLILVLAAFLSCLATSFGSPAPATQLLGGDRTQADTQKWLDGLNKQIYCGFHKADGIDTEKFVCAFEKKGVSERTTLKDMCNNEDDGCGRCSARKYPDTEKEHFTCELAPYKAPPRPVVSATALVRDEHGYLKYADIAKTITHEANVTCVAKTQRMEGYDDIVPVAVCKTEKPRGGWAYSLGTPTSNMATICQEKCTKCKDTGPETVFRDGGKWAPWWYIDEGEWTCIMEP
ncbi:hypothetical protein ACCO45_010202 [Purpureocillium lilacinum]|uniref:Uncharacterized protein n=1 Tax=Purpureocillium lilacinum TaxID=33203 RepID=A0ACC4DFK5_PURLI